MVLKLRTQAPDWSRGAKCLGEASGPAHDLWFDNSDPEDGGYETQQELARDICNGAVDGVVCPLREDCLLWALVNNERFGVWGGTSEVDRRAIRKMWPWPGGSEPHAEWTWYPPGEVSKLLPDRTRAAIEQEDDDD